MQTNEISNLIEISRNFFFQLCAMNNLVTDKNLLSNNYIKSIKRIVHDNRERPYGRGEYQILTKNLLKGNKEI